MNEENNLQFFACLGEILRDINAIEFLMRCSIAEKDDQIDRFPKPPYTKGKIYKNPPESFLHLNFEIIKDKFNKRFPDIAISNELVQLRHAMAHGIIAEVNNSGIIEIIKFKETGNGMEIQVEFSMRLERKKIAQIRQSVKELRIRMMKELKKI